MSTGRITGPLCCVAMGICGAVGASLDGARSTAGGMPKVDQGYDELRDDSHIGAAEVSGQVFDAVTGAVMPDVDVRLARRVSGDNDWIEVAVTRTLSDGHYNFSGVPAADDYRALFGADGYKHERYDDIALYPTSHAMLEPVRLVNAGNAGSGDVSGLVMNGNDGSGLADVTVEFREGIRRRSGEMLGTVRTDANGRYQIGDIGTGNVTAAFRGESVRPRMITFQILGDAMTHVPDVTVSMTRHTEAVNRVDNVRVVLTEQGQAEAQVR